ncbi:MAG: nitrous oxide-stimulated promoter family protein [Coriobacteriales bacterium]|nr:nitrous oxide-stimulated promoter family protein [Coriobacteriales bacterium]
MNSCDGDQRIVEEMIALFCKSRSHAASGDGLCAQCEELASYARRRVEQCPLRDKKPFCSNCPIQCYAGDKRQRIQEVMRFAGPRMLLHHPVLALRHLVSARRAGR